MIEWIVFLGPALLVWATEGMFGRLLAAKGLVRPRRDGTPVPYGYGLLLLLSAFPFYLLSYSTPGGGGAAIRLGTAALSFGLLGFMADRWGDPSVGGWRGHLRKVVREYELTAGFLKVVAGVWVSLLLAGSLFAGHLLQWGVSALLIALTVNGMGRVDTRPVRAAAVYLVLTGIVLLTFRFSRDGIPAGLWPLLGAALAYLPVERAGKGRLGESGTGLRGGTLGFALVMALSLPLQVAALIVLLAFYAMTERRPLDEWFAERPRLKALDEGLQGRAKD